MTDDDQQQVVDVLLRQAGLTVPDNEVQRLASLYPGLRRSADRFHALDVGDEVPAGIPRLTDDGPGDGSDDAPGGTP
ncbi:MAG: hypothetical protein AAFN30_12555 [Actinomycetota bacterium]